MRNPNKQCVICDNDPETSEDIIPKWLQKHFDLQNQKLKFWNDTTFSYKQALIKLCKNCNNERLSRLENRVKEETASYTDYYLWALKIRFLLSVKDTTLQFDRKDHTKGSLVPIEQGYLGHEFIKNALLYFEDEKFDFEPNPFGSVILFDNPIEDGDFGFVDAPSPYWGVVISLPNNKILATLFTDRGIVKKELEKKYKTKAEISKWLKSLPVESTNELSKIIMLKMLMTQYQIKNIPYEFSIEDKKIISKKIPRRLRYKKNLKKDVIIDIALQSGFDKNGGRNY